MRAVWLRTRADLRRHLPAWLTLALVVGIASGAAIAVAAAARRTDSAYERFLATHSPSDVSVTESKDFLTRDLDLDAVAALPEVERSTRASLLFFLGRTEDGRSLTTDDVIPLAGPPGALGMSLDRWKVLDGRRYDPTKIDEAVLDYEAAHDLGLHVGDTLTLKFIRRSVFNRELVNYLAGLPDRVAGTGDEGAIDQLPFDDEPEFTFRIVGIATDPVTFPPVPGQFRPFLRLTPAFYEREVSGADPRRPPLRPAQRRHQPRRLPRRRRASQRWRAGLLRRDPGGPCREREPHAAPCRSGALVARRPHCVRHADDRDPGALPAGVRGVDRPPGAACARHDAQRPLPHRPRAHRVDRRSGDDRRGRGGRRALAALADRPGAGRRAVTRAGGERRGARRRRARRVPRGPGGRRGGDVALDPYHDPPTPARRNAVCRAPRVPWARRGRRSR